MIEHFDYIPNWAVVVILYVFLIAITLANPKVNLTIKRTYRDGSTKTWTWRK